MGIVAQLIHILLVAPIVFIIFHSNGIGESLLDEKFHVLIGGVNQLLLVVIVFVLINVSHQGHSLHSDIEGLGSISYGFIKTSHCEIGNYQYGFSV